MRFKIPFSILLGLMLIVTPSLAQDYGVSVNVNPTSMTVNPCDIATFEVEVSNLGEMSDNFIVLVEGIPEDWYSLSHESIDVPPKSSENVYLFITPYCYGEVGTYEGTISVLDQASDTASFTLNVVPDHIIEVSLPDEVTACLCEDKIVEFTVSNTGEFSEDVVLSVEGDAQNFITISDQSFTIDPEETRGLELTVESTCEQEPDLFTLQVNARSTNSYAQSVSSTVIDKIRCYKFDVMAPEEVIACLDIQTSFEVEVQNTGTKRDNYELSIESLDYAKNFSLDVDETEIFEIPVVGEETGSFDLLFTVSSQFMEKTGSIIFNVEKCFDVDLTVPEDEFDIEVSRGKLITTEVKNLGTRSDVFNIISDIGWISIRPKQVSLQPEEMKDVYIYYSPEFGSQGTFVTELSAESNNSKDTEQITINVIEEEMIEEEFLEEEIIEELPEEEIMEDLPEEEIIEELPEEEIVEDLPEEFPEMPIGEVTSIADIVMNLLSDKLIRALLIGIVLALIIVGAIYAVVMR